MKKISILMLLSLTMAITSCDQDGTDPVNGETVTFNLSTEYEVEVKSGSSGLTRYIVEIYKGNDLSVAPIYQQEQAGGTFTVGLDATVGYTCLFWADKGVADDNATGVFNASSLKAVALNTDKVMEEAFFAKKELLADSGANHNITLERAMARVNLIATDVIAAGSIIETTHNAYRQFNVFSGEVLGETTLLEQAFPLTAFKDTIVRFLTFASVDGIASDVSIGLRGKVNTVPNVPLFANRSTNIKGQFSFLDYELIVDVNESWGKPWEVPLVSTGVYTEGEYEGMGVWIDGLWWAPVNVGYTAENKYGLLFNWGKNVGFEYGTTGQSATDGSWALHDQGPCPDGWRVPTFAEYGNLLTAANSPVGTTDSYPGQWRTESDDNPFGLAGRWFGPDCLTATKDAGTAVFFPAAGYWYGFFGSRGSYGYYWSSTSGSDLYFYSGHANMYSDLSVSTGLSLRCVQN